jgi:nucleotide-binding universal stress UspA family protein
VKTILAAVDSSNMRDAVLAEAVALARTGAGRVVLLTVVQPPVLTSEYAPVVENFGDLIAAGEKAAASLLASARQSVETDGVGVETVQVSGAPVAHILEQAAKHRADYIVMGSHGHTAFYDLLVGSTTHGVLMRANCPVVIVPPKKKQS